MQARWAARFVLRGYRMTTIRVIPSLLRDEASRASQAADELRVAAASLASSADCLRDPHAREQLAGRIGGLAADANREGQVLAGLVDGMGATLASRAAGFEAADNASGSALQAAFSPSNPAHPSGLSALFGDLEHLLLPFVGLILRPGGPDGPLMGTTLLMPGGSGDQVAWTPISTGVTFAPGGGGGRAGGAISASDALSQAFDVLKASLSTISLLVTTIGLDVAKVFVSGIDFFLRKLPAAEQAFRRWEDYNRNTEWQDWDKATSDQYRKEALAALDNLGLTWIKDVIDAVAGKIPESSHLGQAAKKAYEAIGAIDDWMVALRIESH